MKSLLNITESKTSIVFTGSNAFDDLAEFVKDFCSGHSPVFILVDENTREHCLPVLRENVPCLSGAILIEMKSGEEQKSHESTLSIWSALNNGNADRRSLLINLGGGVISDLGGFAAATFKRGIPFVNVPTTLMGMVDAALGGKTSVNLEYIKNQVGVFALPEAVFIWPEFLKTLDPAMVKSGLGEVLKYGLIQDRAFWEMLEASTLETILLTPFHDTFWEDIILRSVNIKNEIVREDFSDRGVRQVLNFGHTFGHAFESLALMEGTRLPHGNAIAMGMICESYLSFLAGGLKEADLEEITIWITGNFEYYPVPENGFDKILDIFQKDKKRSGEKMNFTLLAKPGKAVTGQQCDPGWIREAFQYYQRLQP